MMDDVDGIASEALYWCRHRRATTTWEIDEKGRHVLRLAVPCGSRGNRVVVVAANAEASPEELLRWAVATVVEAEQVDSRRALMRVI